MRKIKNGFTLMEIIIVVAFIALIAVAVFVLLNPLKQIKKSWDGKRKTELDQLRKVLENWYNDKNCYPKPAQICYDSPKNTPRGTYICHICGQESTSPSFSPYLLKLPCDPEHPTKKYLYQVENLNCPTWYKIYATLDTNSDPAIAEVGCSQGCGIGDFTGFIFNYGVTSPNTNLEKGPGKYACYATGCTAINNTNLVCFPSFSDVNCGGQCNNLRSVCTQR